MVYTEEQKQKDVEEFRKSHNFVYEFVEAKGILASDLRKWIKWDGRLSEKSFYQLTISTPCIIFICF